MHALCLLAQTHLKSCRCSGGRSAGKTVSSSLPAGYHPGRDCCQATWNTSHVTVGTHVVVGIPLAQVPHYMLKHRPPHKQGPDSQCRQLLHATPLCRKLAQQQVAAEVKVLQSCQAGPGLGQVAGQRVVGQVDGSEVERCPSKPAIWQCACTNTDVTAAQSWSSCSKRLCQACSE